MALGSYLRFLTLLPCSTSFTASYRVSRETLLLRGEKTRRAQGRPGLGRLQAADEKGGETQGP